MIHDVLRTWIEIILAEAVFSPIERCKGEISSRFPSRSLFYSVRSEPHLARLQPCPESIAISREHRYVQRVQPCAESAAMSRERRHVQAVSQCPGECRHVQAVPQCPGT